MQIVVNVDEGMILAVAQKAVQETFTPGNRWETGGAGATAIRKQVIAWAEAQNYKPMIEQVAPNVLREAVQQAVTDAVRTEVKRVVKTMKETGELTTLFDEVIP